MTTAVYAGSFDPITRGHRWVIERAARSFAELIVVVAVHPTKQALFSIEERVVLVEASTRSLPNVSVAFTNGLVVELARVRGATVLVRGVRDATDLDGELALAAANAEIAPEIATLFVPTEPSLSVVSSSELKARARRGDPIDAFCDPPIAAALRARLGLPHADGASPCPPSR